MKKYLLDTNAIICGLNSGIKLPKHQYIISIITEIELFSYPNLNNNDEENLKLALSKFKSVGISEKTKEHTIKIRRQSKIKLPDSIIIATAIIQKAILVTSDKQLINSKLVEAITLDQLCEGK